MIRGEQEDKRTKNQEPLAPLPVGEGGRRPGEGENQEDKKT